MLRRTTLSLALLAGVSLAEVRIKPPGPYMYSPPPPVDTTPLDPNRKPTVEIAPQGVTEQWYGDWDLVADKSPSGPIQISKPRKGDISFQASFDQRGWITQLVHFDARGKERWTKLFTYPSRIPAGPGEVPVTINWSKADGSLYDLKAIEAGVAKGVPANTKKIALLDLIGDPFVMKPESDGGETWIYATATAEHRFRFDRKGRLAASESPVASSAAPVAASPASDTTKAP